MRYCLAILFFALMAPRAWALDLPSIEEGPVKTSSETPPAFGPSIIVLDKEFQLERRKIRKLKKIMLQDPSGKNRIHMEIDPDGIAVFKVVKGKLTLNIDSGEMVLAADMIAGHKLRIWVVDSLRAKSTASGLAVGCKTDTWAFTIQVIKAGRPPIVLKRQSFRHEPLFTSQRLDSVRKPGGNVLLTKFPKDTKDQKAYWDSLRPKPFYPVLPPFVNPPARLGSFFNQPENGLIWFDRFGWRKGRSHLASGRESIFGIDAGRQTQLPPPVVPPDLSP